MEEQYRGSEDQSGKNHAHGDRLTMDEEYKGHHIQSVPRHLLPDSERWTVQVLINWTDGRRKQFRRFDVKRGFATQGEAEQAGLTFAKKWIDDGKPPLRESGAGGS
jgi:hypothetical protein